MIDFKEELKKFKPVLEIEDLDDEVSGGDIRDMMELLQNLAGRTLKDEGE